MSTSLTGRLRRAVVSAVVVTACFATGYAAVLGLVHLVQLDERGQGPVPTEVAQSAVPTPLEDPVQRLIEELDCSTTGLPPGEIPASALVRRLDGTVEHVTFDRGWKAYTSDGPATLVAVCRSDPPGN